MKRIALIVFGLVVCFSFVANAAGGKGVKGVEKTETVADTAGSFKAGYRGYGGGYGFLSPKYINHRYCTMIGIRITWLHSKFRSIKIRQPISGKPLSQYPILYDGPLRVGQVLKVPNQIRRDIAYYGYTDAGSVSSAVKFKTLYSCPVR